MSAHECKRCGVSISFDEWERWHDEHGWGALETAGKEPTFPIAHTAECPYRRAVEARR